MTPNSSLLQWLATFQLNGKPSVDIKADAYYDLADGYVAARILNQISPQYFSDKWLDGIRPVQPNGSWRLRMSNLKRILQKIHDYASDLQSTQFRTSAITPDVAVIAQNFDPDQISRLIQLILFCAINCDKKQNYIEVIRNLPIQVKQDIKEAIEELLVNNSDSQSQKFNASHLGNDSVNSETDHEASTAGQKFDLNSPHHSVLSPSRSSVFKSTARRDSNQSDTPRRTTSQLDISTHSISDDATETVEVLKQKLTSALAIKEEKAQTCHELELRLKHLQLEKEQLIYENEKLVNEKELDKNVTSPTRPDSRRLSYGSQLDSSASDKRETKGRLRDQEGAGLSQNLLLQQNKKLQSEVFRLEESIIKIEAEKEDYRLKSNLLKEDLDKIATKNDDLRNKAELAKRLQDELDEHKQLSERVGNYEAQMENLRKRNAELKKELKGFEEKNVLHIRKIVELEEDNRQLANTIGQIEVYKKQLHEAQVKLSEITHRADKAEVEFSRLSEKHSAIKKENEKLYETTNQLMRGSSSTAPRIALDTRTSEAFVHEREFESVNLKSSPVSPKQVESDAHQGGDMLTSMSTSVIELRERIAKLAYENELLQNKANSKREQDHSVLGGLLEISKARCSKLELENSQSRKRILMLENRLKDLTTIQSGVVASTSSGAPNESSSENKLIGKVEELQRLLFLKEQELMDMDAKKKRNIQKARAVMKKLNNNQSMSNSFHPSCMSSSSFNSSLLDETNLLKQQLRDREERLIELEREFNEYKKIKEMHERLIMSAFYSLTTTMQWRNIEERLERTTLTSPPNTASSSLNHSKHSH